MDTNQALERYRASMRRRNLRSSTIYSRCCEIRRLVEYMPAWQTATRHDLERYLDWRDLGAKARYGAISHLSQWYRWARREELVEADPTELLERPRLPRRLPRPAKMGEISAAIDEAPAPVRTMLALMADGGLRCCEVAALEWHDVDLDAGVMYVTGKGGHERMIGLPDRLRRILAGLDELHGPVVGRRLKANRVSQIVNAELRARGIRATAHQLRHLYGTRLLAATGDITAVQQALGHASITSTQIYTAVDPTTAIEASRRLAS